MNRLTTILMSVAISALGICGATTVSMGLKRNDNPERRVSVADKVMTLVPQRHPGIAKPRKSRALKNADGTMIKAPRKSASSGATIYGYLGIDLSYALAPGLYTVSSDLSQDYLGFTEDYNSVAGAVVRDGKLCYYYTNNGWGYLFAAGYKEIDMTTGETTEVELNTYDYKNWVLCYGYSERDSRYYGYDYKSDATGLAFFSAPADDPSDIQVIAEDVEAVASITVNQITNEIIAMSFNGDMIRVDPSTGSTETLLSTGIRSYYITGLCYSPYDGGYLWQTLEINDETEDYESSLYLITDTGEVEKLGVYTNALEYLSFYCADQKMVDDKAPVRPELSTVNFPNGSLSGKMDWQMPTLTYGGDAISSEIDYQVMLDDAPYTQGTAGPGEIVSISFKELSEGYHYFAITAALGEFEGRPSGTNMWIGPDTPCAPEEVSFTETEISWTPVTNGVHKGYLDLDGLTYNVYLDDNLLYGNVKGTSIPFTVPDSEISYHVVKVEAVCGGKVSAPTFSDALKYGHALDLPVHLSPNAAEGRLFTILDNNDDRSTWEFIEDYEGNGSFVFNYNDYNTGDDFLVLPPVNLDSTEVVYEFSFDAYAREAAYPEKLEVFMGTSPTAEAMTIKLLDTVKLTSNDVRNFQILFKVPESGVYYLALHAVSDPNMFRMYAENFTVRVSPLAPDSPSQVGNLTAMFGDKGELYAEVGFTMPERTVAGEPIPEGTLINAEVVSAVDSKTIAGLPGEKKTVRVNTEEGLNSICVRCSIEGVGEGQSCEVQVFTGFDVPGDVADLKITPSRTGENARMTWNPPATGANGGYVDPEDITYYLCVPVAWYWEVVGCIGTNVLECEVPVGEDGQYLVELGVISENSIGQAEHVNSASNTVGKPYSLPAKEVFKNDLYYMPYMTVDDNAEWGFYHPNDYLGEEYRNEGNIALIARAFMPGESSTIQTPLFSTKGMKSVSFSMECQDSNVDEFKVYVGAYGKDPIKLYDASESERSNGYHQFTVALPSSMVDCEWVRLYFQTKISSYEDCLVINKWMLREVVDHDLSVTALNGPMTFIIDGKSMVTAEVTNEGQKPEKVEGLWKIMSADGTILMEKSVNGTRELALDETETFTLDIEPTVDFGTAVKVEFMVRNGGAHSDNDIMTMKAGISTGGRPMVTDLHIGNISDGEVTLEWSAPILPCGKESFENERPGIDTPSMIAGFTNIDGDGVPVYGFSGWNFPCVGNPQGWFVWNVNQLNRIIGEDLYTTSDGTQLIAAFSPADGTPADDWLISPEIKGGTTVSFMARPIDADEYGAEKIELLYSADDTSYDDFTVIETIEVDVNDWREYSVELPEDARYFALRYVGVDNFGVLVDELTYSLSSDNMEIVGYDVLRDNVEIANKTALDCIYTTPLESGEHAYHVVPVLADGGKGLRSNGVTVSTNGIGNTFEAVSVETLPGQVIVKGAEGLSLSVVTPSGMVAFHIESASPLTSIDLPAGAYMLSIGSRTYKIMVK